MCAAHKTKSLISNSNEKGHRETDSKAKCNQQPVCRGLSGSAFLKPLWEKHGQHAVQSDEKAERDDGTVVKVLGNGDHGT